MSSVEDSVPRPYWLDALDFGSGGPRPVYSCGHVRQHYDHPLIPTQGLHPRVNEPLANWTPLFIKQPTMQADPGWRAVTLADRAKTDSHRMYLHGSMTGRNRS